EMGERDREYLFDLAHLGNGSEGSADTAEDRGHEEARHRLMRLGEAQDLDLPWGKADLLLCLAQRGGHGVGVARIDLSAGEGDLSGVMLEPRGALRQD